MAYFLLSRESPVLRAGKRLGRYELLAPLGRGGMGEGWVARLRSAHGFHKLVAVRPLLSVGGDQERMERTQLEAARIASLIQHANVVQTLELGEQEGTLYLITEWVDGEPLSSVLTSANERSGVPLMVAVNLVGQALRGLQAAHELVDAEGDSLGLVHRDVSLHNILVSYSGVVKVADFGLAQVRNQRLPATAVGEGKFGYLAPEQRTGGAVDQRTDLFAVGILLYLLTTGRHPFEDHAADGVLHGTTNEAPPIRPSQLKPGYGRTLEAVVMKALDEDRDHRWSSAEEMRLALERGVPQAFSRGFEAQVRAFIADATGNRAAETRDSLRQAERTIDASIAESALLVELGPAPSAGSLRAISIDRTDQGLDVEARPARKSRAPTVGALAVYRETRRGGSWPLLLGGAVACAAALILVVLARAAAPASAATSAGAAMVELAPPRAIPNTRTTASAASPAAQPSASSAPVRRKTPTKK